jgi:protein-S-isoprenylcysteine O-methyltransferase Ste14
MRRNTKDNILMSIVGIVFFLNILLLSNVFMDMGPSEEVLTALGWAVLIVGASFVVLSVLTLRRYGTTTPTDRGVYGIVRHPMYLGGMVIFFSHILFGQHWMIAVSTLMGLFCCLLVVLSEDQQIVAKFGPEYKQYMMRVPRLNFVAGIVRYIRRRRTK